jgi:predicted XRE-type DNA-binding protein
MAHLKNYSRYEFDSEGVAVNKQTGSNIKIEGSGDKKYYRLTDDKGKRVRVFVSDILKETAPKAAEETTAAADKPKSNKRSKLTTEQVEEIRNRINSGEKQSALAVEFNVHQSTISEIKNKKLHAKQ